MKRAFSLVEVLAAIAIIGIITFLAIPNIIRVKEDGERNLAISRAEALNMGIASYLQSQGQVRAANDWSASANRYSLIRGYLAFAPTNVADYMPDGYSVTFPSSILPLTEKVGLVQNGTNPIPY